MRKEKASDLHISSGVAPYLRVNGEVAKLPFKELSADEVRALLYEIINPDQQKEFEDHFEFDCTYPLPGVGRFRCNYFMQRRGPGAVFRMIPEKILTVADLNLPVSLLDMINCSKGLILVTGPTGSGKSTTLAALIDHINANEKCHILTIEDPIEFVHESKMSLINQRELHSQTKSFNAALKAALREDPDIILVGEMRDIETISLAISAAETGHVVFGTLHTNSAPKTVDRIIDAFPPEQQEQIRVMLSESLRGVISQGLIPKADRSGRFAALEVLVNTSAVANLIREGKTFQIPSIMQTGRSQGMFSFESYCMDAAKKGIISVADMSTFLGKKIEMAPTEGGPMSSVESIAKNAPQGQTKPTAVSPGMGGQAPSGAPRPAGPPGVPVTGGVPRPAGMPAPAGAPAPVGVRPPGAVPPGIPVAGAPGAAAPKVPPGIPVAPMPGKKPA